MRGLSACKLYWSLAELMNVVVVVINAAVQCFCACTILESKLEMTNLETITSPTLLAWW